VAQKNPHEIVAAVVSFVWRFRYRADKPVDSIRIVWTPTGRMYGDCDDFAATALWLVEGRTLRGFWAALLRGRAALWRCKTSRGVDHMILWHEGYGWIENDGGSWTDDPATDLKLVGKINPVQLALKMVAGKIAGAPND
jgi:hypothetical protein